MMNRRAKLDVMYNEYIRVSGLNDEGLMSEQEKVERKRSFMAGISMFTKFITESSTKLSSTKAGDMLKDVDRQLKSFWKGEQKREFEEAQEFIDKDYKPEDDKEELPDDIPPEDFQC